MLRRNQIRRLGETRDDSHRAASRCRTAVGATAISPFRQRWEYNGFQAEGHV
jgi:hypothetical protein